MKKILLDGRKLCVEDVLAVANGAIVDVSEKVYENMAVARSLVDKAV